MSLMVCLAANDVDGGVEWARYIARVFIGHFDWSMPLYGIVDDVLTAEECVAIVARARSQEWLPATVNGPDGRYRNERMRDNDLTLMKDDALRTTLYEPLRAHLPPMLFGQALHSVHPSLRVYRYRRGQHFGPHSDQPYFDDEGRQSRLTLLVYLDERCEGGETALLEVDSDDFKRGVVVKPRRGRVLWFQHMLLHEGRRVTSGEKHVLRTDAIYA